MDKDFSSLGIPPEFKKIEFYRLIVHDGYIDDDSNSFDFLIPVDDNRLHVFVGDCLRSGMSVTILEIEMHEPDYIERRRNV